MFVNANIRKAYAGYVAISMVVVAEKLVGGSSIVKSPSAGKLRAKSGKTTGRCAGKGIVNFCRSEGLCENRSKKITARGFS